MSIYLFYIENKLNF